jgi:hypothetical protein
MRVAVIPAQAQSQAKAVGKVVPFHSVTTRCALVAFVLDVVSARYRTSRRRTSGTD